MDLAHLLLIYVDMGLLAAWLIVLVNMTVLPELASALGSGSDIVLPAGIRAVWQEKKPLLSSHYFTGNGRPPTAETGVWNVGNGRS